MTNLDQNKQIIQNFVQVVWEGQNLDGLKDFWTEDCVNHAMPGADNQGLAMLRAYHESFFTVFFSAFSNLQFEIVQQVAEADRVVTYISTQGTHSGAFYGIPPTGKRISTSVMRIDRIRDSKISEHWSVSDAAGLVQQIQA